MGVGAGIARLGASPATRRVLTDSLRARLRVWTKWLIGLDRAAALTLVHQAIARVAAPVEIDRGAALLAAPLALGLGAAAYFGLETEPAAWPASLAAAFAGVLYVAGRRLGWDVWPLRAVALAGLIAAGFALADLRVDLRASPVVVERSAPYDVEGWVEIIDASSESRRRYTLRVVRLDGASVDIPRRVRVSAAAGAARLGDKMRVRAVLGPPQGPPVPQGYDFSRAAYFEQLGGVGYAMGAMKPAPDLVVEGRRALGLRLTAFRGALTERLREAGGGGAGGIMAALVTGDRSEIEPDTTDALYISGLGHALSISGMHLALVGGGAFFLLAWSFAAIEPLARRVNVRKLAAAGALGVSFAYLMISGAEAPAVRSFVMAGIAFAAILVDRRALTQRGVAVAALAILAVAPENASHPGFQMSFAAVVALVASNDLLRERRRARGGVVGGEPEPKEIGVVGVVKRFLFGLTVSSMVAGMATAPFAAFHFNRVGIVGFFANLVAMPIFSGVVMPLAAVTGLLTPFGLEEIPGWICARAVDLVVFIGVAAAEQPGALSTTPSAPAAALGIACIALVAGSIVRRGRWRIALPLALLATGAWRAAPEGDLWIGEDGGWVVRAETAEGVVWLGETGRSEEYGAEMFARRAGFEGAPLLSPRESDVFACDATGCVGRLGERTIAIADRWSAVVEDCRRGADLVLTPGRAPPRVEARCAGVTLIPRRGRPDRGGVIDLGAERIELLVAGAGRPWRPS